uniref:Uncharacterized protein n=1 Tax=Magnetococcus massalia (strain MO-1) TaxID=451514 RepID=A0A1S7LFU8_MAGMO|nr:conserved protein of unknown function [Candidatus Magnetococcus massalia]
MLDAVKNALRDNITHPRELTAKHGGNIATVQEVDDPLDALLSEKVAEMEEWEQERWLSPLFTPTLEERKHLETALPVDGMEAASVEAMIRDLEGEALECEISYGGRTIQMAVPNDTIERYAKLFHADNRMDAESIEQIKGVSDSDDDTLEVQTLLRSPTWQSDTNRNLLNALLGIFTKNSSYSTDKIRFLSDFVRTNRPQDQEELGTQLQNLIESYQFEQERPIFNQRLEQKHTTNIRSKLCGEEVKSFRLKISNEILGDLGLLK